MRTALLLIAHGSRQPEANADLTWLAEQLRGRGEFAVIEPSYLELANPTIAEGGRRCVEQQAERVLLVPYFLAAGTHVQLDLQDHCRRLQAAHPEVQFLLAAPLGRHELLVDVALACAREALTESASNG